MYSCQSADGRELLPRVSHANNFWLRLKGLLGRKGLDQGEALLIEPCNSVHTLGMKFPIGVVFLNTEGQILHLIEDLPPGRLSPIIRGARRVLELRPEQLRSLNLQQGDRITFVKTGAS